MNRTFTIGTGQDTNAFCQGEFLYDHMTRLGHSVQTKFYHTDNQHFTSYPKEETRDINEKLSFDLRNGKIDIIAIKLSMLPSELPEQLKIAALSERKNFKDCLIFKKNAEDCENAFGLPNSPKLICDSHLRKVQAEDLIPSVHASYENNVEDNFTDKIEKGEIDGIILAEAKKNELKLNMEMYESIALHPEEFVTSPAQGVTAYIVDEHNSELRKILANIHHYETGLCTNIEREIMQMFQKKQSYILGAYCRKDQSGNYHATAAFYDGEKLKRSHISLSTSASLAEEIFKNLTKS